MLTYNHVTMYVCDDHMTSLNFMMMAARQAIRNEYKFLADPPDELLCLICLGVAREPLQHEGCGKLFCKECLERHGKDKPCSNCRKDNSSYYLDKRSKHSV